VDKEDKMQDFKNLTVWQAARRFTRSLYQLTADFPASEEFGLKAQMRRASISICSNIAEGCARRGDREFRRFLDVAMGSACELECELILSFDLAFIVEASMEESLAVLIEIKRMLSGLISSLFVNSSSGKEPKRRGQSEQSPLPRRSTGGLRTDR
jgi:four helix bundle protein